jgi:predicted nucleic acid-binding Zn finger protein
MGENTESLKIFSIVFNNKVMQISYNTIFPEFKNQTVKSLIELILEKSLQANQKKDINEYNFFCPCGNIIESSKSLGKNLCDHKYLDYKNNVNKGKYLLVEKQNQNLYNLIKENEKELSKEEINKIINEFTTKMKIFTDAIKNLSKNKINKYENYNNLSVEQINHSLTTYIREEKNIAEKMMDNTAFLVIAFIPVINLAQWGVTAIAGFFDYVRSHKEEFEGIIKEYERSVNQNISIFQDNVENNIKSIEKNACEIIKNIFMINGNDLNKIKNNQKIFENVIEDLENYFFAFAENN